MSKEVKEVWASSVDTEMVRYAGLSKKEVEALIKELDDAVMRVCEDFRIC